MRRVCATAVLIMLSACASHPEVAATACTEPRPLVCTMQFLPTCAVLAAGGRKEFASPCTACADAAVMSYVTGPCAE